MVQACYHLASTSLILFYCTELPTSILSFPLPPPPSPLHLTSSGYGKCILPYLHEPRPSFSLKSNMLQISTAFYFHPLICLLSWVKVSFSIKIRGVPNVMGIQALAHKLSAYMYGTASLVHNSTSKAAFLIAVPKWYLLLII